MVANTQLIKKWFSRAQWKHDRRLRRDRERMEGIVARRATALSVHFQHLALNQREAGVQKNAKPVVVSLTTFDKRLNDVHLTIESLFQQSRKADRVVLWLSEDDCQPEDVPEILRLQQRRGLELRFVEKNLGPYKKFFYALNAFPDALLLTVDDDVFYPLDMIDQLYRAHCRDPEVIHCHRAHGIRLGEGNQLLPYKQWDWGLAGGQASRLVFPTGIGGVLYFPGCFDDEIHNEAAFQRLAPNADDVWLKAMSLKKGVACHKLENSRDWARRFVSLEGSQTYSLKRKNKSKRSGNDLQLQAVFDEYGLWDQLRG